MGVSGSGKSTVAGILAGQLGWDLAEGDDLHPAANVAKMSARIPLTDEDRWPWLDRSLPGFGITPRAGFPAHHHLFCSQAERPGQALRKWSGLRASHRLQGHHRPAALHADGPLHAGHAARLPDSHLGISGSRRKRLVCDGRASPSEIAAEIIRRLALTPKARAVSQVVLNRTGQSKKDTCHRPLPPGPRSGLPDWR
jgi:gluconokinase